MRTTIRLNDGLLARAKEEAIRSGRTLTAVVEDALRLALARKSRTPKQPPISLISCGEGGLRPGVDLNRTAELLDIMDEADGTA
jgi:hypothetical protein